MTDLKVIVRFAAVALMLFFTAVAAECAAPTPYSRLELKADRFFAQKEWAQASATYYQMLEQRPDVPATYGKAIVAGAVRGDTLAQMELMARAMRNKIPFDSVLSRVKSTSFELGRSNLYGDFLQLLRKGYPWMRRPIDNYLLRYYTYRNDGRRMMEYSTMMLQGAPANVDFLMTLGQGAMLCGKFEEGINAYERILAVNPENYDALLALGNYYYVTGNSVRALPYLQRAQAIRPTPHVQQIISSLLGGRHVKA